MVQCIHIFSSDVPTSRAVSLVVGSDAVVRDQFYTGNFIAERSAIVLRLAPSWLRFGSYEIHSFRKHYDLLRALADFTIKHYFTDIDMNSAIRYVEWFSNVVDQTAFMVAK